MNNKYVEINERIRDRQVRLIEEDGTQIGIVPIQEAQGRANRKNLDLVKISPNANPPVCKIMDYGKFKFDTQKREKEARKNQKASELKEVRLSMTIDKHDVETKAKHARKFLLAGDKVKVTIRMRGRQQTHANLGVEVMRDFFALCEELAVMERKPSTEGREIIMILVPSAAAAKSAEAKGESPAAKPAEARKTEPQGEKPAAQPRPTGQNNDKV